MKNFIINFIVLSLAAWGIWGLMVPASLPLDVKKAFIAVMAFAVLIFTIAFTWIEHLFNEFGQRGKK